MPERFLDPKSYREDDMDVFHPFLVGRHKCVGVSFAWSVLRLILAWLVCSF
ncbi:cytochrome P450 [Massilia sp. CT11-108]|uniref:cytochrome P450 n=1 Tax=Massilia sp. CT11-108 TaxID=3393900 RepID=UPI0039A57345